MSIEVNKLVKQYGTQKAVNDISFSISKGEVVGFLGPNGAGKSTTMKMITGYLLPDAGEAVVNGISVREKPLLVKKNIGYLPEANPLYYDMYVKEYLLFIAGVHQVQHKTQALQDTIELTGLSVEKNKKIGQLSKGYKQRVGLAAALIHDPEVLILDEPTSGLDPNQIIEIRNVIKEQGKNKTILFSSHILQEVQAICDRVIIINKGQIVADDSLTNLQKTATNNELRISFTEPVPEEFFINLPAVKNYKKMNENTWLIFTDDAQEARRTIMKLALQHDLNIVSLHATESNLEEVFRSLTSGS